MAEERPGMVRLLRQALDLLDREGLKNETYKGIRTLLRRIDAEPDIKEELPAQFLSGVYKHYKGGLYQVLGLAESATTGREGELEVIFICLYTHKGGPYFRTRLFKEWFEIIEYEGEHVLRFEFQGLK